MTYTINRMFPDAGIDDVDARARKALTDHGFGILTEIDDLDGGAKFADLAKQRSTGPTAKNGGDVGWFAEGEMIPEFSNAAFKIKPGSYGKEPVKSQFGWHVIYVEAERERSVPDLKLVEGTIRQKLSQEALAELVKSLRAKADIQRFDADGKPVATKK